MIRVSKSYLKKLEYIFILIRADIDNTEENCQKLTLAKESLNSNAPDMFLKSALPDIFQRDDDNDKYEIANFNSAEFIVILTEIINLILSSYAESNREFAYDLSDFAHAYVGMILSDNGYFENFMSIYYSPIKIKWNFKLKKLSEIFYK